MADRGEAIMAVLNGMAAGFTKGEEQRRNRQIEDKKLSMLEQEAALTREARELEIGSARRQEVEAARSNLRKQKGQMLDSPETQSARKAYGFYGLPVDEKDTEESLQLKYGPLSTYSKIRAEEAEKRETERAKGKADPTKDIKENQWKAAGFARRMESSLADLETISSEGYQRSGFFENVKSKFSPEEFKGPDLKRQEQAELNFLTAVLRKESGANIAKEEIEKGEKVYFDRSGDDAKTKAQKAAARQQALRNMMAEAGKALGHIPVVETQAPPPKGKKAKGGGVIPEAVAADRPPPGSIIKVRGKRFRVAEDGDTLEPL